MGSIWIVQKHLGGEGMGGKGSFFQHLNVVYWPNIIGLSGQGVFTKFMFWNLKQWPDDECLSKFFIL